MGWLRFEHLPSSPALSTFLSQQCVCFARREWGPALAFVAEPQAARSRWPETSWLCDRAPLGLGSGNLSDAPTRVVFSFFLCQVETPLYLCRKQLSNRVGWAGEGARKLGGSFPGSPSLLPSPDS